VNLFATPLANGFTADPTEAILPSITALLFPTPATLNRLAVPSTCSYSKYAKDGQCSLEYNYLNSLFTAKDLTMRLNVERCWDYPNSLSSVNLQCVSETTVFTYPTQFSRHILFRRRRVTLRRRRRTLSTHPLRRSIQRSARCSYRRRS
jgi:hypothetical protein